MRAIFSLLTIPAVGYVVMLKTVMGIPAGVFQSMFTVVNIERLGLTPETNGQLLSYLGFITMVTVFTMRYVATPLSTDHARFCGGVRWQES